ncbi:MAG: universal stress protein [Candidatus Methanofastidiosia archaeon]
MEPIFKKIVVPIDGSDTSLNAAKEAIKLAGALGAKIVAIYVIKEFEIKKYVDISHNNKSMVKKEFQGYGLKYLEKVKDIAKKAGVPVDGILCEGIPAEEIVQCSKKQDADLIVMGSRGNTGFRRKLLGSTTDRVIRWSGGVPVLVITR